MSSIYPSKHKGRDIDNAITEVELLSNRMIKAEEDIIDLSNHKANSSIVPKQVSDLSDGTQLLNDFEVLHSTVEQKADASLIDGTNAVKVDESEITVGQIGDSTTITPSLVDVYYGEVQAREATQDGDKIHKLTKKQPLDFVVNVTTTGSIFGDSYAVESADKTYAEILDAYRSGKRVYLLVNSSNIAKLISVGASQISFTTTYGDDKLVTYSVTEEDNWRARVTFYYSAEEVDYELEKITDKLNDKADAEDVANELADKQPLDFVVNVITTGNANDYSIEIESADKTYAEILEAHNAGRRLFVLWNNRTIIPLSAILNTSNGDYITFNKPVFGGENGVQFGVSQSGWHVYPTPDYTYLEIEDMVRNGDDAVRTELMQEINAKANTKDVERELAGKADKEELKLIKTITLTEAVTSIGATFEKPLKEIYMVFTGTLDGIANEGTSCIIAARCNGGSQYLFYKSSLKFAPNTNKVYIAHAKEIVERRWETVFAGNMLVITANGVLQGLDASSSNPRMSYSSRKTDFSRYIDNLDFFVYGAKYSFAVGSTLEIYGVEVDE